MSILKTAADLHEEIGGETRRLKLRNGEIERFEEQYAPFGLFGLWGQLLGGGSEPQVRHVRDIVALGLVGAGMPDKDADKLIADLPPSENIALRAIARRLLGVTFIPGLVEGSGGKAGAGKKSDGSAKAKPRSRRSATTRGAGSATSAE
jgi:hypothetical protein